MKIAVIGAGNIGGALGERWAQAGHTVVFGVPDTNKISSLIQMIGAAAKAGTVQEALVEADAVLMAAPFKVWPQLAAEHSVQLSQLIVIDASNPDTERDGEVGEQALRFAGGSLSFVAELLPNARLVKAFNTIDSETLRAQANRAGSRLAYPLAGNDPESLQVAATLVRDAGFDYWIVGDQRAAKNFDPGNQGLESSDESGSSVNGFAAAR